MGAEDPNPFQQKTASFFYSIWPLSRFIGYRPPSWLHHDGSFHSQFVYHVLPTSFHRQHIERLQRFNNDSEKQQHQSEVGNSGHNGEIRRSSSGEETIIVEGPAINSMGTKRQHDETLKRRRQEREERMTTREKFERKLWHLGWTFLASFTAISFLALSARAAIFFNRGAPVVVAAFATEAVILFSEYQSPLAQPRNIICGNIISAVIGVGIQKLFLLQGSWTVGDVFGPVPWAAAAISLSTAILVMQLLEITHPPGGATALLATTLPSVAGMGWFFIVQIIVDTLIILGVALLFNNLGGRRYPTNWWWPSKKIII